MEEKDQIIEQVASLIGNRDKYQLKLGKLALEYRNKFGGMGSLKELSMEIKERHGLTISPVTLHNYSWIELKLGAFDLPEDISFNARQAIAGTENPQEWVKKITEGMSSREIIELIKGKRPRRRVECPVCKHTFEVPTYVEAKQRAKEAVKEIY